MLGPTSHRAPDSRRAGRRPGDSGYSPTWNSVGIQWTFCPLEESTECHLFSYFIPKDFSVFQVHNPLVCVYFDFGISVIQNGH